ncbi:cell wall-active antibiotics response protein LiaF [Paenibacillus sp. N3.4]|uniref:cell wall-active antibiotics response protein LiaF n=1 Tax=Paenibacillus sp. N3.4 TaxID=2603222 RepID=UPI00164F5453|nr:cell wall-active antibiotics response protein LiaF [Paenibacillus sp. N3.4]
MNPHMFQRVIWGLVLVTVGVLFLLNQMGLIEINLAYVFSTYWPVILIVYGLIGFVWQRKYNWGSSIWSLLLCGVGTIFLLKNLRMTDLSIGDMFKFLAPVALILFGLNVIFKPNKRESPDWQAFKDAKHEAKRVRREARRAQHERYRNPWDQPKWTDPIVSAPKQENRSTNEPKHELSDEEKAVLKDIHGEFAPNQQLGDWDLLGKSDETKRQNPEPQPQTHQSQGHKYHDYIPNFGMGDVVHRHGFIGDVHLGQEAWELKPIQVSHFIGDSIIDLTRATIPLGETTIHVTAFIGDVKIFIPNDFDVEVRVMASSFIGDMKVLDRRESGFLRSVRTQTSQYDTAERKIIVTTSMFIGDITIKKIG